jgi:hypothetical protein
MIDDGYEGRRRGLTGLEKPGRIEGMKWEKYPGHGGARVGAGRKPVLSRQLARAEKVAQELRLATRIGLNRLAGEYDELMIMAISVAKGDHNDGKPDKDMLKFLLNLSMPLIKDDGDEPTSVATILERVAKRGGAVTITQNNVEVRGGPAVPSGAGRVIEGTWRDTVAGTVSRDAESGTDSDSRGGRGLGEVLAGGPVGEREAVISVTPERV